MKNWLLCALLAAALVAAPIDANAQAVTYYFTGVVIPSSSIAPGTPVTGTYTFNLGNATSTTAIASLQAFNADESSGTNAYVFSDSLSAGTFSYTTASPGASVSMSQVASSNAYGFYGAVEQQNSTATTGTESGFTLQNASGVGDICISVGCFVAVAGSDYLPLPFTSPPAGSTYTGYAESYTRTSGSAIRYTITSLTLAAAPEIDAASAASGLTLLLGSLLVLRARRSGGSDGVTVPEPEPRLSAGNRSD